MTGERTTALPDLSVVVIARNEEDRIGDCLNSVFTATDAFDSEVVVVDSNSTDRTVERAREFPVSVLRIPDDDLTTPSAGRFVGAAFADGEQVLFVDGDMVLEDGWLEPAAEMLAENPDLAGVGGHLDQTDATELREPDWLHGVALYDADALASVGGFDPFLRALEDLHLGFELTAEGYRLARLPVTVSDHAREASDYLEPVRRWRRGFFHGVADALFRSASSPRLLAAHLRAKRHALAVGGWLLVGFGSLVALPAFLLWLAASAVGFAVLARLEGFERAYKLVTLWVLLWGGVATHEWRAPRERDEYPLDSIEEVESGPRLTTAVQGD
ncbi:glycosyltransferase [Halorussus lipolyticus]|uniref:glycosyltransferase n=1 Tax=Halorussus lipolyticus TaxID=3034024 RepID=UPI0023E8E4AB|nr:glycosyltransferase family 2 protein [Halorussus sp. DT80]